MHIYDSIVGNELKVNSVSGTLYGIVEKAVFPDAAETIVTSLFSVLWYFQYLFNP